MTAFQYALNHYQIYLLVLLRMVAFIALSPILSVQIWPNWAKLGLGAYVALLVAPTVTGVVPDIGTNPGGYIIVALQETVTGMILGFVATIMFSVVVIAGQMFDVQIGFNAAALFNPQESQPTGLTSTVNGVLFTLYFLGVNGLDGLVLAMLHSYQFIGLGHFHWPANFWVFLVQTLGLAMTLAVQLAAPLLTALLLTDVTFALLSRAVPQMNVFVVGLPAKLFVGLVMFAAAMPGFVYLFGHLFALLFQQLNTVLETLKG